MAILPPPEHDDPELLREIRDLDSLAVRIEDGLGAVGDDQDAVWMRDAILSNAFDLYDFAVLQRLVRASECDAAALSELEALARRYQAGEFVPPDSFFGLGAPEA